MSGRVMGSSSAQQSQEPKAASKTLAFCGRRAVKVGTGGGSSAPRSQWLGDMRMFSGGASLDSSSAPPPLKRRCFAFNELRVE